MGRIVLRGNQALDSGSIVVNDMSLKSYLILLWVICLSRGRYRKKSRMKSEVTTSNFILDL